MPLHVHHRARYGGRRSPEAPHRCALPSWRVIPFSRPATSPSRPRRLYELAICPPFFLSCACSLLPRFTAVELEPLVVPAQIASFLPRTSNPPQPWVNHLASFHPNPINHSPDPHLAGNRRFPVCRRAGTPEIHLHADNHLRPSFSSSSSSNRL